MSTPNRETRDARPEVWAGAECTVNRVGEDYFDQLALGGHDARLADLDLLASLKVTAVRYPVLWERTAPRGVERADFTWADERLARLRELNLRPVVGLVHHGSGPLETNLLDAAFAEKLARYARAVARRYPWVADYTPVNEPLTTARFSALYGHWYPHARDPRPFARALVNQCRAVVLSMRAVREVNPEARLVQTEDLGKTYSTPQLAYQAEFENERRWLTCDLLTGRVTRAHALWDYLTKSCGVAADDLLWFADNPCPPDIVGINHYLTSERFLDHRRARYPAHTHGGNGRDAYADVEAVRVCAEGLSGPRVLLREAWKRYGLPVAVTEVHLGCTREEQMRWLKEVWDAACALREEEGADVRAVTVWSAFGSHDWHNLLTRAEGRYEPGVFDVRGAGAPRPTALAPMVRALSERGAYEHPALDGAGWWRRLERLCYPPVARRSSARKASASGVAHSGAGGGSRPILITGATGTLGRALARVCRARGLAYELLARADMDIADARSVASALDAYEPWAVVNAAGYVRVDDAEVDAERCARENAEGPAVLARECARRGGVALVTFSSDLVFDGAKRAPYVESDAPAPLNVYGRTKLAAERGVLAAMPDALVVRTSAFFGPWDEYNFVTAVVRALARGERFAAASDETVSPTYVPDLAHATLDLLLDGGRGVWHLANAGETTWAELARRAAALFGYDARLVDALPSSSFARPAARPLYTALASERASLMPTLEDALGRYAREREERPRARAARAQSGD
ncbi:MAG TPA: family 1 glycosylhydrolase [Pyrinomonadaceae bacterium]|nr:family 1 glycosylhydrolase [Pyrinomonadaceae bacterium]